eukprot:1008547-Rhodomonas_salina.1
MPVDSELPGESESFRLRASWFRSLCFGETALILSTRVQPQAECGHSDATRAPRLTPSQAGRLALDGGRRRLHDH